MILSILKKYSESNKKKKIIRTIIQTLKISEKQKELYLDSMEILDDVWLDKLYKSLTVFIEEIEVREIDKIKKENFAQFNWLRKNEAEEKQKEVNTFNFLINNL